MTQLLSKISRLNPLRLFFPRLPKDLKTPFLISLLTSSVITLSFLVLYWYLQPQVPIFYSLAEPQDYLVNKEWLVLFPFFTLVMTFLHLSLLRSLFHYDRVIQQLFIWTTVVWQIILAISFFRIIWIVM